MEIAAILVMIALIEYLFFGAKAGMAREAGGVAAPAISGDETFERLLRVQMNTLEQLIVFVPGMFIFAYYLPTQWVVVPGVAFIVGRLLYFRAYVKDPASRTVGFVLSFFANVVLVLGSLGGAIYTMMS